MANKVVVVVGSGDGSFSVLLPNAIAELKYPTLPQKVVYTCVHLFIIKSMPPPRTTENDARLY
jgi:hypothetical protein